MSSNIKIQIKEAKNSMILKNEDIIFIPKAILTGNSIKRNLIYNLLKYSNSSLILEWINKLIGVSFLCEDQEVQHSEFTKYFDENNESLKAVYIRGNNMFDVEMLRIEKLIEEREVYESAFFSMKPMFDYEDVLIEPFEEDLDKLRDEKLIKEREIYEIEYFEHFNYEIIENDLLDSLIESYEESDYSEFDFEMYYDECFGDYFEDYHVEEPSYFNHQSCGYDLDYMPNDDIFDYLDCYDYPDGPNENIEGIIFSF